MLNRKQIKLQTKSDSFCTWLKFNYLGQDDFILLCVWYVDKERGEGLKRQYMKIESTWLCDYKSGKEKFVYTMAHN